MPAGFSDLFRYALLDRVGGWWVDLDVVALQQESQELIQHAEQIEMWGIYHLARQLHNFAVQLSDVSEAVQDQAARDLAQQLDLIDQALRAVDI